MYSSARVISRRALLGVAAGTGTLLLLAACGDDDESAQSTATAPVMEPTNTPAAVPNPTATPPPVAPTSTPDASGSGQVNVLVDDVVAYELDANGRWDGPFGSVTFKMHHGHVDDIDVMFIRTDASDKAFAEETGLVWVPIMAGALQAEGSYAHVYLFENGLDNQGTVLTTLPGRNDYTPAFNVHYVRFDGPPELLTSEAAILAAADDGALEIIDTNIVVNYPFVRWGSDGLPVDPDLNEPLGVGPLVDEPDLADMTCTFKLHECFPGSRYIVTDTSAVPMAPMMGVVGSGATEALRDVQAVAPITIFVNGLDGPGVMGFQPAIFNERAGHPAWSPFWDHFAVEWADPDAAVVVRNQAELDNLVASGDLILYNGLPDTHPMGFIVNCPAPILAPNNYGS